jgi:hypothetical protein
VRGGMVAGQPALPAHARTPRPRLPLLRARPAQTRAPHPPVPVNSPAKTAPPRFLSRLLSAALTTMSILI